MKKFFLFIFILFIFLCVNNKLFAQGIRVDQTGVAVNIDDSSPDPTAILDVSSTTKGILVPRVTTYQRTAISSPANGLLVFDITLEKFYYYNGTVWVELSTSPDLPVTLTQGGATTITGNYPDFTISSTDNNTTYTAGTGIEVNGTTITNLSPNAIHTGEVTGSTTLTIANNAITTDKILDYSVTAAKLNSMWATNGQVLKFNGTNWAPAMDNNTTYTAGSGLTLNSSQFSLTSPVAVILGGTGQTTYTNGQLLIGNTIGNTLAKSTLTSGTGITITNGNGTISIANSSPNYTHTGDVTGATALTIANNAVTTVKILDGNVTAAKLNSMSATTGQILTYNGTAWAPATLALREKATGNLFVGTYAGNATTTGSYNTFTGYQAGFSNTTSTNGAFLGYQAGYFNTASNNTFIGYNSGYGASGSSGTFNSCLGGRSGYSITTGGSNTISGYNSGYAVNAGSNNTFYGTVSGSYYTSGNNNTCIGYGAGSNTILTTGSANVIIGYNASPATDVSNTLWIENTNVTVPLIYGDFTNNRVGINRITTTNILEVGGDASKTTAGSWLANSDRRIKKDITEINDAYTLVMSLHPVKFKYTDEWMKINPSIKNQFYYNFIAQEYQKVFPESVKGSGEYLDGDSKEILQIDTYNSQIITLKAVQQLIKENEIQTKQIESLKAEVEILKSKNTFSAKK